MKTAVSMKGWASESGMTRLDVAALWYLALPNLIYLAAYLTPWVGIPAALILTAMLMYTSRGAIGKPSPGSVMLWIMAIAVALVWLFISGIGHFVFANPDWTVRDIVLHDLAVRPWPVQYSVLSDPIPVLLRAPLGYFLPAALGARLVDTTLAIALLFCWTLIGVVITLVTIAANQKRLAGSAILIFVFVFFSGMDIVGYVLTNDSVGIGTHLEWWALFFQYSSITTQLFWVPNHALPGWIVAAWFLRHMDAQTFSVRWAVLLVAMTPMWSPLAAIGLGFIMIIVIVARVLFREGGGAATLGRRVLELIDPVMLIGGAIVLALIAPFLVMSSGTVPGGLLSQGLPNKQLVLRVFYFVMIEFGIFWMLMVRRYRADLLLATSGVLLLILPWVRFGPNSDLTMRASIPALVIFAIRLGEWFSERLLPEKDRPIKEDPLASLAMIAFVIGMATPFQEMARAFVKPAEVVDTSRTVYGATNGAATHYLAPRTGRFAESIIADGAASAAMPKEIHVVPPSGDVPATTSVRGISAPRSSNAATSASVSAVTKTKP